MSKSPIFPPEEPCEYFSEETVRPSGRRGRMPTPTRHYAICTLHSEGHRTLSRHKPKCGGCKTKCDFGTFGLVGS